MTRNGLPITFAVLALAIVFCVGVVQTLPKDILIVVDPTSTIASATILPTWTSSPAPTWTSSPVPTVDDLATTRASSDSTTIAVDTQRASTQTAIAIETSSALESEAFAALARERDDAHAIALAQIAELEAKKHVVELTFEPTTVSIARTEDARQRWRQVALDRVEDEARAALIAEQLENEKKVALAQTVGLIALYAGLPIVGVLALWRYVTARARRLEADRDVRLSEISTQQLTAELEHDLQMRRAEILNLNDRAIRRTKSGEERFDARMTIDRLRAFVNAAVLASGPSSNVLTWSGDPIWKSEGVEISHREWAACADELERLEWLKPRAQGKPTELTDGATLGDIQRALYTVLQPSNKTPLPSQESEIPVPV